MALPWHLLFSMSLLPIPKNIPLANPELEVRFLKVGHPCHLHHMGTQEGISREMPAGFYQAAIPSIKLSSEFSTQPIHFLDAAVNVCNGHLTTVLHQKATDHYSYLHGSSRHPKHTTRSVLCSQALSQADLLRPGCMPYRSAIGIPTITRQSPNSSRSIQHSQTQTLL